MERPRKQPVGVLSEPVKNHGARAGRFGFFPPEARSRDSPTKWRPHACAAGRTTKPAGRTLSATPTNSAKRNAHDACVRSPPATFHNDRPGAMLAEGRAPVRPGSLRQAPGERASSVDGSRRACRRPKAAVIEIGDVLLALARDSQAAATLCNLGVDTGLVQPTIDRQHTCDSRSTNARPGACAEGVPRRRLTVSVPNAAVNALYLGLRGDGRPVIEPRPDTERARPGFRYQALACLASVERRPLWPRR